VSRPDPRRASIPDTDQSNKSDTLRVCLPTSRRFVRRAFQGAGFEAQDVLAQTAGAELIELEPGPVYRQREALLRKFVWHDFSDSLVFWNPGLRPVQLAQHYDLLVAYCMEFKDLLHINAITNWRQRCSTAVCVLDEIWTADIVKFRHFLAAFQRFDHIVIGCEATVQPLSEALGRPCHFVPPAADALRFSPYPDPPERVIDVYSLGRRREAVHQELLKLASSQNKRYVHDTVDGGGSFVVDHRKHRAAIADLARSSHCFMVAPAKIDMPEETHGQIEVPNRYYEGAMAGAVLVGERVNCDSFRRLFAWPDAVVEVRPDGTDTFEVVSELLNQPDRLLTIGRRNAVEALRRHDWLYRWNEILHIAGLEPTSGMHARARRLSDLADSIEAGVGGGHPLPLDGAGTPRLPPRFHSKTC
jgi:hypothetical protein